MPVLFLHWNFMHLSCYYWQLEIKLWYYRDLQSYNTLTKFHENKPKGSNAKSGYLFSTVLSVCLSLSLSLNFLGRDVGWKAICCFQLMPYSGLLGFQWMQYKVYSVSNECHTQPTLFLMPYRNYSHFNVTQNLFCFQLMAIKAHSVSMTHKAHCVFN